MLTGVAFWRVEGIQETGYGIQNTGYRIQETGDRIQDTGYRIQDTGDRIQDTGYRRQAAAAAGCPRSVVAADTADRR